MSPREARSRAAASPPRLDGEARLPREVGVRQPWHEAGSPVKSQDCGRPPSCARTVCIRARGTCASWLAQNVQRARAGVTPGSPKACAWLATANKARRKPPVLPVSIPVHARGHAGPCQRSSQRHIFQHAPTWASAAPTWLPRARLRQEAHVAGPSCTPRGAQIALRRAVCTGRPGRRAGEPGRDGRFRAGTGRGRAGHEPDRAWRSRAVCRGAGKLAQVRRAGGARVGRRGGKGSTEARRSR